MIEVFDHHRIGSFQTLHPILFVAEPVGCTNTLIAELYEKHGVEPRFLMQVLCSQLSFQTRYPEISDYNGER